MKDIIYIVEQEIVDKMNIIVTVDSFIGNVLSVCDVKWARIGMIVTDGSSNEYTVTAVDYDLSTITVSPNGAYTFSGTTLTLVRPYFFVGTPIATNKEWKSFNRDERKKVPFAWMLEPTSESFNSSQDTLERESSLIMIFLDSNNVEQWNTKETHSERLRAIYNMVEEFINTIKRNALFYSEDLDFNTKNFTKFGRETSSGMDSNIIDANLAGIELRLTLSVNRLGVCIC